MEMDGNSLISTHALLVDWDSDDSIAKVRTAVAFIKKGCGCKTGCLTSRCKCKKGGNHCGPGCKCLRCCNLPANTSQDMVNIEVLVEETEECDSDSDDDVDNMETEVDDIMNDIFDGYDCASEQSGIETSDNEMDVDV